MNATTVTMLALLNEAVVEEYNTRMTYIKQIIARYKYIGVAIDIELVDNVCDKSISELRMLDNTLDAMCKQYAEHIVHIQREGLDYE
jgi:hypothetical protein